MLKSLVKLLAGEGGLLSIWGSIVLWLLTPPNVALKSTSASKPCPFSVVFIQLSSSVCSEKGELATSQAISIVAIESVLGAPWQASCKAVFLEDAVREQRGTEHQFAAYLQARNIHTRVEVRSLHLQTGVRARTLRPLFSFLGSASVAVEERDIPRTMLCPSSNLITDDSGLMTMTGHRASGVDRFDGM